MRWVADSAAKACRYSPTYIRVDGPWRTRVFAGTLQLTPTTNDMTVLTTYLVEDSPVIQQSLIATLQELTPVAVVGMAADEQAALQWLADPAHEAELVIVDIFLRSGSGVGVLRGAQQNKPPRHMVVLSNYATPDVRATCMALGAQQVFDKSTEIDALILYCQTLAASGRQPAPAA